MHWHSNNGGNHSKLGFSFNFQSLGDMDDCQHHSSYALTILLGRESFPVLDQYIVECLVSTIIINNGLKEPTWLVTKSVLIFGRYLKVRKSMYTQVVIWVSTILTKLILVWIYIDMKFLGWYIDPSGIENKNILNYPHMLVSTRVKCVILVHIMHQRYSNDIKKKWYWSNIVLFDMVHLTHCHVGRINILDLMGPPLHVKWAMPKDPFFLLVQECDVQF